MTIVVFGRSGQLARELDTLSHAAGGKLRLIGRETCDLSRRSDLDPLIGESGVTGVINAAAYTRVDQAESEIEAAYALNREAPAAMAEACARRRLPFVHISTDYVFDGEKGGDYVENDARSPLNAYGASKAAGEAAVRAAGGRHAILRTSWLFSAHGMNFLRTMVGRAAAGQPVSVVADQRGRPSWAADIARAALLALARLRAPSTDPFLLHVAGDRALSWADFAELIFAERRRRGMAAPEVRRVPTAAYPTPARRPRDSTLAIDGARLLLDWRPTPLETAIARVMDQLTGAE